MLLTAVMMFLLVPSAQAVPTAYTFVAGATPTYVDVSATGRHKTFVADGASAESVFIVWASGDNTGGSPAAPCILYGSDSTMTCSFDASHVGIAQAAGTGGDIRMYADGPATTCSTIALGTPGASLDLAGFGPWKTFILYGGGSGAAAVSIESSVDNTHFAPAAQLIGADAVARVESYGRYYRRAGGTGTIRVCSTQENPAETFCDASQVTCTFGSTAATSLTLGRSTVANTVGIATGVNTAAQVVNVSSGAAPSGTQTVNIASGAGATAAQAVNILNGAADAGGTQTLSISSAANGAASTVNVQNGVPTAGAMAFSLQSGAALPVTSTVSISNGAGNTAAQAVNIMNGASAAGGAQTLNVSGGVNLAATAVNIASGANAANTTVHIADGTNTAGVTAVFLGSDAAFANTTAVRGGNGATAITIAPNDAGAVVIGGAAQTGALTFGQSTVAHTTSIDNASCTNAACTVNVGAVAPTGTGTTSVLIGSQAATAEHGVKIASARQTGTFGTAVDCGGAGIGATVTQILDTKVFTCATAQALTLPTAQGVAGLVQVLPGPATVGDSFQFIMNSTGAAAFTLTAGAGGTVVGNAVRATNASNIVTCIVTGVGAGAETISCY